MTEQLELFETALPAQPKKRTRSRDVDREAKEWLDRTGISAMPRDTKALIAAKLMAEFNPEMHKILLIAMATTIINPMQTPQPQGTHRVPHKT